MTPDSSHDPLDSKIKGHYESVHLSSESLARLRRVAEATETTSETPASKSGRMRQGAWWAVAAAFLVLGATFVVLMQEKIHQRGLLMAQSVATSHSRSLPPDYLTADVHFLNQQMTALDFPLCCPKKLDDPGHVLVGGKYCSVEDKIAAQLKWKTEDTGEAKTLFAFRPEPSWVPFPDNRTYTVHGTVVKVWMEDNIGYVLAVNGR